jgi:ABC-type antimicrobial peptide transport system permease subunit
VVDNKEDFEINTTIGSTITLFLSFPNLTVNLVELTIVGIYEQEDLGAPEFVPRQYNLYTSMETAWVLRAQGWQELFPYYDYYTKVNLLFDVTNSSEARIYVNKLNSLSNLGVAIEAYSLGQFGDQLASSFSVLDTFTAVISIITALAGGMAIIVAQLNSVTQRMSEFAILKATGWKNRHIFKDIVLESLILGLMGSAIAVLLGWGIISLFSSGFGPFGSIRAIITIDLIIMIFGFGLAVGIVAGLYPGYKAASVRPVQVLKGG